MSVAPLPVVFASDNDYAVPLLVSAYTLMAHANEGTIYQIIVLVPSDFAPEYRQALCAMAQKFSMPVPILKDMGVAYADVRMRIEHTSPQTYYRLMIPDLCDFDVCLYLDVDLVVRKDLSELFGVLEDDELVAGVKAAAYYWPPDQLANKAQEIKVEAFDQYVNAGVLVMNVRRMRELGLTKRFAELLKEDFRSQDQDIINSACYGAIHILPPTYNSMAKYFNDSVASYESPDQPWLAACYTREEWITACEDPAIVHYASRVKPWNMLGVPRALLWWEVLEEVDAFYPCKHRLIRQLVRSERAFLIESDAKVANVAQMAKRLAQAQEDARSARAATAHFAKSIIGRCTLRLASENKPTLEVLDTSDQKAHVAVPSGLGANEDGVLVASRQGELELTVRCSEAGRLRVSLMSDYDRDADGRSVNRWLSFSELSVNDKNVLARPVAACFAKPFVFEFEVEKGATVHIRTVWDICLLEPKFLRERAAKAGIQAELDKKQREVAQLEEEVVRLRELVSSSSFELDQLTARFESLQAELDSRKSADPLKRLGNRILRRD